MFIFIIFIKYLIIFIYIQIILLNTAEKNSYRFYYEFQYFALKKVISKL